MNRLLIIFLISAITLSGCGGKDPIIVPANGVRAVLFVNHHGVAIPYCSIFVKNNTVDFPGTDTTQYDARYVTDATGHITISGIPNGQSAYIYYAKGVDPNWDTTGVTPVWGYNFIITDTRTGESKDYSLNINVSE